MAERIFVLMTIPFFAYPIAAVLAHPTGAASARRSSPRTCTTSHAYLFLFVATAGTTITPFMQLYVQSAVVERGVGADELTAERAEVVTGSIFANLVAGFIIIATGADAVPARRAQHLDGRAGRQGARAVRRAATPRCCSPSACSAPACSRRRSCP